MTGMNIWQLKQQELCSFTRFETQCRTPEAPHKTPQKVCVWCVFESHTHSANAQKLSHGLATLGQKSDLLTAF